MSGMTLANLAAWSVQVTLLAIVAAAVARVVPLDAAGVRYAWWRLVLVACFAIPVAQPWQVLAPVVGDVPALEGLAAPQDGAAVRADGGAASPRTPESARRPWGVAVAVVLAAGAALRLGWLALGLLRLRRFRGEGEPARSSGAPDELQALQEAGADVRYVARLRQPVTFGVTRPVVLLPSRVAEMPPGVQRAVLAHELWHVRRRDWMWSLAEELLLVAVWFHPAIWYLVSRVQAAREEVVDELSVLLTSSRRAYLEALLAFADEPAIAPAAPFMRRGQLFTRMLLVSKEEVMSSRRIVASGVTMVGVFVITGWYAALAFPLTTPVERAHPLVMQTAPSQPQPRDPRSSVARPATARELELHAATKADPASVANWIELARLQEQRGALAEAEATFRDALAATGQLRQVLVATAAFLTRTGQFDKATATLEDAAARNPADPSLHQLTAIYYWEKAQKDLALHPSERLTYIQAGIAATDRALAHKPDYTEALTYKNILLRMQANLEPDTMRRQQFLAEADALRARAMELGRRRATVPPAPDAPPSPGTPGVTPPPPPPPPPPPAPDHAVDGQQPLRVGGEIRVPTKLRDVRPEYPQQAQDARVAGIVILEAVIDTAGKVRSARVLRSIPLLDEAAIAAVEQWRFTPTLLNGTPVPVIMTVSVNFTLQ